MMGYWSRLGRAGDPNGDGAPTWEPYALDRDNALVFEVPTDTTRGIHADNCDFWDSVTGE
jgi:carboxylesterase type B